MVRIQKQLVVLEDVEFGYGKVIQKRTVDGVIVDREYGKINAENIPAKNPIGSETDIQTELDSKLDMGAGDLVYAKINGNETETFKVANPTNDNESIPLSRLNTDLGGHTGNTSNPHNVTKSQIGLGNVDNTSDVNKPISNATQAALDMKAPSSHLSDTQNPHSVTYAQVGADQQGTAAVVQSNLDTHSLSKTEHGLKDDGAGDLYLADNGIYKSVAINGSHNELDNRDALDSHPIAAVTGLQTSLDGKADDGDSFLTTEHVSESTGVSDAGKPIILDGTGYIHASLTGLGLYFVAMYTPDAANEYPDDTGENTGAYWGVEGVDPSTGYTFVGGDLQGATVNNGDMVVRGSQEWGYRGFGDSAGLFLRIDGSNSMGADLPMGTNKIVSLAPGNAAGDAVEFGQIASFATDFVRVDGSIPMEASLDMGTATISNLGDGIADTDAATYGQHIAHSDNINNPHAVTAAQVGAVPITGGTFTGALNITGSPGDAPYYSLVRISPDGTQTVESLFSSYVNDAGGHYTQLLCRDGTNEGKLILYPSGAVNSNGTPVEDGDLTTKVYVDNSTLPITGGTINGDLTVGNGTDGLSVSVRGGSLGSPHVYFLDTTTGVKRGKIFLSMSDGKFHFNTLDTNGTTATGGLIIHTDNRVSLLTSTVAPTSNTDLTHKLYVDTAVTNINTLGDIKLHYGDITKLGKGWSICDGTKGTPDLTGSFLTAQSGDIIPYIMYIGV